MTVIWKITLKITDEQIIELPASARILSVANQQGKLCLWALVSPGLLSPWTIAIIGTGNPIESYPGDFIGTVVIDPFVWHVFAKEK